MHVAAAAAAINLVTYPFLSVGGNQSNGVLSLDILVEVDNPRLLLAHVDADVDQHTRVDGDTAAGPARTDVLGGEEGALDTALGVPEAYGSQERRQIQEAVDDERQSGDKQPDAEACADTRFGRTFGSHGGDKTGRRQFRMLRQTW